VVLAALGAEVDFYLALGDDELGRATEAQLRERGVRPHVGWRDQMTRRAITYLSAGGDRTIVTIGERLEPRGDDDLGWERLRETDGVYFTAGDVGTLDHARQGRVLTATPRGRDSLDDSDVPLDALIYSDEDADETAWAMRLAPRSRLMVATQGALGGRWWGASEGRWSPVPPPGEPRDAYGCGDAFAAAFTLGLGAGDSIAEAARLGAEQGALALTRVGAP
jgi:sugar/nucleoside kinase (ribokinase family)